MKTNIRVVSTVLMLSMVMGPSVAKQPQEDGQLENGLWKEVAKHKPDSDNKVTIVGEGQVGTSVAFSLLTQFVTDEIVLIGRPGSESKVNGEIKDLNDGSGFIKSPKIIGGTDYALSENSKIIIVTVSAKLDSKDPTGNEPVNLDKLAQENIKIYEEMIPQLAKYSPNAVYIIVSNPVDIMTYVTWKLLGKKNTYRIIGSGTNLDSQYMKFLIARELHTSPESVHGWVIGEHGKKCVTAWSEVNVAGVNLKSIRNLSQQLGGKGKNDDWFAKIHKDVANSATQEVQGTGRTVWAVSLSVSNLVYSILHNIPNVHAVSTLVKGYHGIRSDVFMSLPCILGETGVTHIIKQQLSRDEANKLKETEKKMKKIIKGLKWNNQATTSTPEKSQATTGTPEKSQATTGTPEKSQATTGTPEKSQATTGTPEKSQATTGTPKKSQATTGTPKKSQATTGTPEKSQATTGTPEKSQATTGTPEKSTEKPEGKTEGKA